MSGHGTGAAGAAHLLEVRDLGVQFALRRGWLGGVSRSLRAVHGVSLYIDAGETLALVGESGCGKTTVARALMCLTPAAGGSVRLHGRELLGLGRGELRRMRRHVQMVFQDPYSSLSPRLTVRGIIGDVLLAHGLCSAAEVPRQVAALLEQVGLDGDQQDRYAFQFSGGQRQRIGIARALAPRPDLLVCDEAVSALDVSVQAQILNLLRRLQRELGLAYLFITHDLNVVRHVAHRIAVMYLGEIVEQGDAEAVLEAPAHPYTQALVAANPRPDPDQALPELVLQGDVPSPLSPPPGCTFHTRCPRAMARCAVDVPAATLLDDGRSVRCHLYPA